MSKIVANKIMKIMFLTLALFLAGCVDETALNQTPEYFQKHLGPIQHEPFSLKSLSFAGLTDLDPSGTIHLYAFANNDTLLHEAFHSFEIRARRRGLEWERFRSAFGYYEYNPNLVKAASLFIPTEILPGGEGYVNLYSRLNHYEDSATCFVELMKGKQPKNPILQRKMEAVRRFAEGDFCTDPQ